MQATNLQNHKFINDKEVRMLAKNNIKTVMDFLHEDIGKLSIICKLSLTQIVNIRNDMLHAFSASLISGATIHDASNKTFISTGIKSLDKMCNGGIPVGHITEVCGLAGSGKTQLCLQLSINAVKSSENLVLYLDTKGDFSGVRLQKILNNNGFLYKEMAIIMSKIKVLRVWSMEELINILKHIKNRNLLLENLAMLIIDSLPCLMFQHLGDNNKVGLSLLNTMVDYCRFVSKEFSTTVVCINIQTKWLENDITDPEDNTTDLKSTKEMIERRNRCLGKYWQQVPSLVLLLENTQVPEGNTGNNEKCCSITASILRFDFGDRNLNCNLIIDHTGIS